MGYKDEINELLLLILKEEREKRKEAQTNLENQCSNAWKVTMLPSYHW